MQNGIRIGGEKYMMVAGEPGLVLRGKKGPSESAAALLCSAASGAAHTPRHRCTSAS